MSEKCVDGEMLLGEKKLLDENVKYEKKKGWKTCMKYLGLSIFIIIILLTIIRVICALTNKSIFAESKEDRFLNTFDKFTPSSRQNRALKFGHHRVCNTNCYANLGFTEADIQAKLDIIVGNLLMNGQFKWSPTLSKVKMAFHKCYENLNNTQSEHMLIEVYKNLLDVEAFVDQIVHNEIDMRRGFTQILLKFWQVFGVDILFQSHIDKTFTYKEEERKSMVYLDQKLGPLASSDLLFLEKQGEELIGKYSGRSELFATFTLNYDLMTTAYENSPLKWQIFTVDEAHDRWPFFDFSLYFRELDYPRNNYKDGEELKFVVSSVEYLDKLAERFVPNEKLLALNYVYYLGFYTVLNEYKEHLFMKQESDWKGDLERDEKLRRCASEIRQQLPLVVSRVFVESLDENDLELRIHGNLTVYQIYTEIWTKNRGFIEGHLSNLELDMLHSYLLPTKFFETDHGYLEEDVQFERVHRRLKLNESQSFMDILVEMRKFNRLRSILCLSGPENSKCDSYYSKTSCAIPHITYLPQEQTINLPVGIMLLLQETYDENMNLMDHHSRFEKMLSTLGCLIRQALKQRMTKSALFWDKNGRLRGEDDLKKILDVPKVFKCDSN